MLAVRVNNVESQAGNSQYKRHIFGLMLQDMAGVQEMREVSKYKADICSALLAREKIGSTCIAPHIAIVHAQVEGIKRVYLAAGMLAQPVLWDDDNNTVSVVFVLLVPKHIDSGGQEMLRMLMHKLADDAICARLAEAGSPTELCQAIGF